MISTISQEKITTLNGARPFGRGRSMGARLLIAAGLLVWGAFAHAYSIAPNSTDCTGSPATGTDPAVNDTDGTDGCITAYYNVTQPPGEEAFLASGFGGVAADYTLLYKADSGENGGAATGEAGTLAGSYSTTFTSSRDGATVTYGSGDKISCPDCYLVVKDGNADPNAYAFDLNGSYVSGAWDTTIDPHLILSGFWPGNGAISHISIYGADPDRPDPPVGGEIPEPGSLALVGLGLMGLWRRRGRKTA